MIGADGNAYYSNFGEQTFGYIDPKTGAHTEIAMPELKQSWPTGMLGLRPDKDGNMWLGMMYQGAIGKVDLKDKKVTTWSMPPEMQKDQTQVNMVRAEKSHVDGKVWSQNNGFAAIHRLDLKTGQIESLEPFKAAGVGETHNIYDIIPELQEQRLLHRHRGRIHRQGRPRHHEGDAVPDAEEAGRTAARHDG